MRPFTVWGRYQRSYGSLEGALRHIEPGETYFIVDNRLPRYRMDQGVVAGNDPEACTPEMITKAEGR